MSVADGMQGMRVVSIGHAWLPGELWARFSCVRLLKDGKPVRRWFARPGTIEEAVRDVVEDNLRQALASHGPTRVPFEVDVRRAGPLDPAQSAVVLNPGPGVVLMSDEGPARLRSFAIRLAHVLGSRDAAPPRPAPAEQFDLHGWIPAR